MEVFIMANARRKLFAGGFILLLAAVLGFFAYHSSAAYNAGSQVFILSSTGQERTNNAGAKVPVVYQDQQFGLVLRQYQDNEIVYLSLIFPDGRVFSVDAAGKLDGLSDMPANEPFIDIVTNGGDYYITLTASNAWPYGFYEMSAWGARSNRLAKGGFYLNAPPFNPGNPGRASLEVEDNTTGDKSGLHGATVNIFGRGFRGQELVDIWITAPDGTVIDYPSQFTSDVGSFASTFFFDGRFAVGNYNFSAKGRTSGYIVYASFNLASQPSTPSGWAQVRVVWRYPTSATQDQSFEITGQFFESFEPISVWATLPDGTVRGIPIQYANSYGEFFTVVQLDTRLPTGAYKFTAQGLNSKRLVISEDVLVVTPGDPVINTLPPVSGPAPVVTDNNNFPGNLGGVPVPAGVPSQDPAPEVKPDF
jgi:hypothetical protein